MRQYTLEDQERRVWALAERCGTFTIAQLSVDTHCHVDTVRAFVRRWRTMGRVSEQGIGRRRRKLFRVEGSLPVRPAGTPEANMWRTARKLRQFTPSDLQMHANTPETPVSDGEARAFCGLLLRGGYAAVLVKAIPGRRPAMYRLVRDTGPRPPTERRVRAIWDANERRYVHVPEPAE